MHGVPEKAAQEDLYDIFFRVGMWWRIAYGILRIFLGLALLRLVGAEADDVFYMLMRHELDSGGHISHTIHSFLSHHSFTVTYFLSAYFIFWGAVDAFLSACLLRNKLWAFPVSMLLICIFMVYEVYRVAHTHSLLLASVIAMDAALVWLIQKEYQRRLATARRS